MSATENETVTAASSASSALAEARLAVNAAPGSAAAREALGLALIEAKKPDKARQALKRAVALDPERASAWAELGALERRTSRFDAALSCLRKAITLDPSLYVAQLNLCWAARRADNLPEAVQAGRKAVELKPCNEAYNYLIYALLAQGDDRAAESACRQALLQDPSNTTAIGLMVNALDGLGRRDEGRALVDFERLMRTRRISTPPGHDSLPAFNAALTEIVMAFPGRPFDPSQTQDLFAQPEGAVKELDTIIRRELQAYLDELPADPSHPYLAWKPQRWLLDGWGTRVTTYAPAEPHFHPHGWLSGVYYCKVPGFVGSSETGMAGCIQFGRFLQHAARPVKSEMIAVRPEEGLLLLFPSYFYHAVAAFPGPELRVSIAFNLAPAESPAH